MALLDFIYVIVKIYVIPNYIILYLYILKTIMCAVEFPGFELDISNGTYAIYSI